MIIFVPIKYISADVGPAIFELDQNARVLLVLSTRVAYFRHSNTRSGEL